MNGNTINYAKPQKRLFGHRPAMTPAMARVYTCRVSTKKTEVRTMANGKIVVLAVIYRYADHSMFRMMEDGILSPERPCKSVAYVKRQVMDFYALY